ncbi:uncharacterized protein LOC116970282, partial [Amblyraja radiata]|uniref:uncharacterized protein LOC116970282 n=1 Tax=Amblyraja radiata TaxID=386614 RepID=UPI0014022AC5
PQTHQREVSSLTFLSDVEFVSTSFDGTVCVWSVCPRTGTRRLRTSLLHSLHLDSPVSALGRLCDRRLLVAELTGRVSVWEPGTEAANAPRSSVKLGFVRFLGCVSGRVLGVERVIHPQLFTLGELPPPEPGVQEPERDSEQDSEPASEQEQEEEEPEPDSEPDSERHSEQEQEDEKLERDSERDSEQDSEQDSERDSKPDSERESEPESEPEVEGLDVQRIYRSLLPYGTPGSEEAWLTAVDVSGTSQDADISLLCGDSKGNLYIRPWDGSNMMIREDSDNITHKQVHSDRVTAVVATDDIIVTASHDQSVRLWDRRTLRQVGFFQCRAPVLSLALSPASSSDLICGDDLGHVYFLRLRPFPSPTPVTGGRGDSLTPSVTEPC